VADGDGGVNFKRRRIGFKGGALVTLALISNPAFACVPDIPPPCEANEGTETCQKRAQQWYVEQEFKRVEYEKKTPAERELIRQAQLWDGHEIIFLARIEKIKLRGKIYPEPRPKAKKPKSGNGPPPPPRLLQPVHVPFGESYSAYIRPIQSIKGPADFIASWQDVGGMTSCGSGMDGSLSFSYPGDEIVIFANWASSTTGSLKVWTKFLNLYGVDMDKIVEPRIRTRFASVDKPILAHQN
jgi:hypothetical protein